VETPHTLYSNHTHRSMRQDLAHINSPRINIELPSQTMTSKPTKFAVYRYFDPSDLTDSIVLQVYESKDEAREYMSSLVDIESLKHPEWADLKLARKETEHETEVYTMEDRVLRLKLEIFDVIEHVDGRLTKVHGRAASVGFERSPSTSAGDDAPMRNDLDITMAADDINNMSSTSSKPEANPPPIRHPVVVDQSKNGTKQYGLYVCPDPSQPNTAYLIMSSVSLGEIESYTKVAAAALLKKLNTNMTKVVATCSIHEKGINILKAKRAVVRYEIVEGRMVNGMFVNEADWVVAKGRRVRVKPELVAYEPDLQGKIPRMVTLNAVHGSAVNADNANATPKPKTPARRKPAIVVLTPAQPIPAPGKVNSPKIYCVCRMPDDGRELIACESGADDCPYNGWFHLACQNITAVPEGEWWCPLCRQDRDVNEDDVVEDSVIGGLVHAPVTLALSEQGGMLSRSGYY